jgi:hypothetical protein
MNLTQLERTEDFTRQTRLEDLSAINYRLQGLAEKKPETQETVLTKKIKHKVRSIKARGWIGSKESNRSRGFSARFARHMKLPRRPGA